MFIGPVGGLLALLLAYLYPIYRGNRWIKYSEKSIAIREI